MIDVQLRSESGRVLTTARGFAWTQELIELDRSAYPLLSGLCAYLDTVFNQRQIPMLVAELAKLPAGVIPEPAVAEIRRLAAMAAERPHRYLWFCGD